MRGKTFTSTFEFVVETCCSCGAAFAMTADMHARRLGDRRNFYCPSGHQQHYVGTSDAQKLEDERARNVHLRDQLQASVEDAERVRFALMRDRHRFANGVCPCCNRYFGNVRRHMAGQHPDYDVSKIDASSAVKYSCSCGRAFASPHGLRVHQGRARSTNWATEARAWHGGHLTVVGAR